jgi:hypothetical protein
LVSLTIGSSTPPWQAFTSVLMIHQVLTARATRDAQVESIKIVPVTASAYELSLREDRRNNFKPGNSDAGQTINVES